MNKLLLFSFFIYLFLLPTNAGAGSVPTFSDQDLERYRKPNERRTLPDAQQVRAPDAREQGKGKGKAFTKNDRGALYCL